MKIAFYTLGCRLNQAETDQYSQALTKKGFTIVDSKKKFDIAIINTCAVTHKAEREGRQIIRKLKRQCPKAKIVMTGCSDFKIDEIDYYIKNKERFTEEFLKELGCVVGTRHTSSLQNPKTRANIKIQTGCDNYCTYCITTHRRGKSRSIDSKKVIEQIKEKVKNNIKEVVLTGVNIGQHKPGLTGLIKEILKQTKIERIRLSSINPEHVYKNQDFYDLFKDKRMCRHLHLSLQSGSDKILQAMNRKYNTRQYLHIVKKYYKAYPDFGFTTDVIVGFPGETDQDFQDSLDFIKECGFLKIHIFRYSKRGGTPAAKMKNQIDEKIKKQRAQKLQQVNLKLQKQFQQKMQGKKLQVLFEKKHRGHWLGHAGNYLLIRKKSAQNLKNKIQSVICKNL